MYDYQTPCPSSPSAAAHHMINHQIPCLSVCQFVVPPRTKPASIAFDSFYRFPQLLFMCRAWLFAKGRIICLARSVYEHVSVCLYILHMLIWLIPPLRQLLKYHYNPIDCTRLPLMTFRDFWEYFLCEYWIRKLKDNVRLKWLFNNIRNIFICFNYVIFLKYFFAFL